MLFRVIKEWGGTDFGVEIRMGEVCFLIGIVSEIVRGMGRVVMG